MARLSRLIKLEPPALPRSRRLRQALEREAEHDPRIRVALDAATNAESTNPRTIRRVFSFKDNDSRIW